MQAVRFSGPVTRHRPDSPRPARGRGDPHTGQDVRPRGARTASPSPGFPICPIPPRHRAGLRFACASSPKRAADRASGSPRSRRERAPDAKPPY
jgi:hypothetical protein